ncbi:uncharacterized protein [Lepeophtheirus salmonis]|uniref:uncharacterized protein n=1 Tax=Lepeophtheirus salmonis TaxID=72036 RepID=UPI001AE51960|nr:zinc finger protein 836-like [Lepeophtheirus salmonis]XP_040578531.1 zinc finger protein 836-like [Lepeophtheirus salmonis]
MFFPYGQEEIHTNVNIYNNKENNMNQIIRTNASSADTKPWVCSVCSKRFAMKRGLTVHVDTIHENSKRFECHLCSRVFNQKGNLNNHIKVSHEGSKDYQCELCDWKFSAVALLDKHMISVHKVDSHFDCDICGQIYDNRKLLRKHKVSFHKDSTGNRMYEVRKRFFCGFCSIGFSFKTFLDKHIASVHSGKHSEHVCKVCDKSFEDKTSLESHTATKHKQIHLQQQEIHKQRVSLPQQQILLTIPETSSTQILQTNQVIPQSVQTGQSQQGQVHIQQQPQQQIFYQAYNAQSQLLGQQQAQQQQTSQQPQRFFANQNATGQIQIQGDQTQAIQPLQLHHFQYQPPLGTTAQPTLLYQPASTQQPHQIQIHLQPLTSLIAGSSPPPAHQPVLPSGATVTATPQPAHGSTPQSVHSRNLQSISVPSTVQQPLANPLVSCSSSNSNNSIASTLHSIQGNISLQNSDQTVQLVLQQPVAEVCDLCNLPCSDKQDLVKHKALFHNFKCEICDNKFPSFESLTIHKISHLTPCPVCEVRFKDKSELLQHFIETHEGKELCNICYVEVFDSKENLAAHLDSQHGPEFKIKCEETTNSVKNEVKEHKKFVSVVDELVVQLQKYKDKSSHRKRKSKDMNSSSSVEQGSENKSQHLGNGNNLQLMNHGHL